MGTASSSDAATEDAEPVAPLRTPLLAGANFGRRLAPPLPASLGARGIGGWVAEGPIEERNSRDRWMLERSRPASRLSEASTRDDRDTRSALSARKLWRGGGGESSLSLLCAFDIWFSVMGLYVVVLAIICTPGITSMWRPPSYLLGGGSGIMSAGGVTGVGGIGGGSGIGSGALASSGLDGRSSSGGGGGVGALAGGLVSRLAVAAAAALPPPPSPPPSPPQSPPYAPPYDPAVATFEQLYGLLFFAAMALSTIVLLALFFLREWALVLFLWKLFELLCLLLFLAAYAATLVGGANRGGVTRANDTLTLPLLVVVCTYCLYTLLLLRQLWAVPRIREHYRRLPTRNDLALADSGVLQFGSFFFRRTDLLGAGGTARVYKGMYAGKLVAVKEIAATAMMPHGRAEAALLSNLRHPYVLHFFGCCVHERHLYIVTELCDMTLRDLVQRRERQRLALEPALSLAMQVAEGLAYLHESGVVHRDLSASNIFLSLDETGGTVSAKIGDFGLSRRTAEQTSMTALIGTIQYMAPEMLTSATAGRVEYTGAVDVFSFGVILWQLITCEQPYQATLATHNRFQLLQRIAREGLRPEVPAFASPGLQSLIVECWADAEHARPPSADLVRRLRLLYAAEFGAEWQQAGARPSAAAHRLSGGGSIASGAGVGGAALGPGLARRDSF